MGRLSRRTIQCRLARKQRDLSAHTNKAIKVSGIEKAGLQGFIDRLGLDSLQRYQQAYGLVLSPDSSRQELLWAVKHHFQYQEVVDESSILFGFIRALRRDSSSESSSSSCMY